VVSAQLRIVSIIEAGISSVENSVFGIKPLVRLLNPALTADTFPKNLI